MNFCNKPINSRSKYNEIVIRRCHRVESHAGTCDELPFLKHLKKAEPRLARKIVRDSTMTTGAAWKSDDAGPNRILRWVMMLSDDELKSFGLDMASFKPGIISKLREKAADYDSCVEVAIKLTWLAYQMENSPSPPSVIQDYLEIIHGKMKMQSTVCEICRLPMNFADFSLAVRGKAKIETCHKNPRFHDAENIGFAHRDCNIAQGAKTLDEFYDWIEGIISRKQP